MDIYRRSADLWSTVHTAPGEKPYMDRAAPRTTLHKTLSRSTILCSQNQHFGAMDDVSNELLRSPTSGVLGLASRSPSPKTQ
ncbi:hypothetical protein RSOL_435330 [Rhizoctonia solani AG-3 Rhs1AP]|uniref:Uncharacterized protein n=1 Tax=Rhizoctonia solani AG-3 Rhs1AP TaxID=1086054 RepID=X8JM74_9AGAM|nr:hypothetical protein RSOL_435330 [Rhizoctonia solani AG-3 Rhs1AP]